MELKDKLTFKSYLTKARKTSMSAYLKNKLIVEFKENYNIDVMKYS